MKGITKWLMGSGLIVVIFLGGYLTISYVGSYRVYAHEISKLPDLVVKEIKCGPGSKLQFTVANIGSASLASGWRAVANVYFDGVKQGHIDLGRPTEGDITPPGGSAHYLVACDILKPVKVKVVADTTNSIKELNEQNNEKMAKITPCGEVVRLPDLVVKEIKCGPGNKLQFTVANIGSAPLPSGWRAVADVYFDGVKQGHIDLGRPTEGDITPAGGSAHYLVVFDILKPVKVRVVADATNEIRELNEQNNEKTAKITPLVVREVIEEVIVGLPDLKVAHMTTRPIGADIPFSPGEIITFQVTVKNIGTGTARGTVRPDGSTTDYGYMIDLSLSKELIRDPVSPHVVPSPYNFVEGMLLKGGRIDRTEDLRRGEEKKYSASVEIPKDIKPGKYRIGVSVDPFNKVIEGPPTGESNNVANYGIRIE